MKSIELLRPGRYTDTNNQEVAFSAADLAASAAAYDPQLHEAPIVIGHPKTDAPAYGWIKSLAGGDGRSLSAEPHQVDAAFAELVKAGRFKKVSASFYGPKAPDNPKPGVWYLRHVGFLGAQPPAVKGLKPIELGDGGEGIVTFAEINASAVARLFRSFRDWLISDRGLETADRVIPSWDIDSIEPQPLMSAYAEPTRDRDDPSRKTEEPTMSDEAKKAAEEAARKQAAELAERETKLADDRKQLETQRAELSEREAKTRRAEHERAVDGLVAAGKVLPAEKAGVVAFMETIAASATPDVVTLGEGNATTKTPALKWFAGFLEALPKRVELGEIAGGGKKAPADDAVALAEAARAYQDEQHKLGRTVSITDAVRHVKGA